MLLLLLASHPACADDLDTLQILLLPIDKSLVDSDLVNVGATRLSKQCGIQRIPSINA